MLRAATLDNGMLSMILYSDFLLDKVGAEHVTIMWGKGYRNAIVIVGETFPYKGGHDNSKK